MCCKQANLEDSKHWTFKGVMLDVINLPQSTIARLKDGVPDHHNAFDNP